MKTLKKFLIGLVVGLPLVVSAQIGSTYSFINSSYQGLYISNSVTFLTNLTSVVNGVGTNVTGVIATNNAGVAVTTNNISNVNLLRIVPLWTDRPGTALTGATTNSSIFVRIPSATAGAAATNGLTLVFAPCPNGTNDSGQSGDWLTVSIAANTAVAGNWVFYYPNSKWPGARGMMLQKVYTTAPTAAASQFVIAEISVSGFVP